MTHSQKIIAEAGRNLRKKILSISSDLEFNKFRLEMFHKHNLSTVDLSKIAGLGFEHVQGKMKAGIVAAIKSHGIKPDESYVEDSQGYAGITLSKEKHGDPNAPDNLDEWWLENCPTEYRAHILEKYIDSGGWWGDLYRKEVGREPDEKGLSWWKSTVTKLFKKGIAS